MELGTLPTPSRTVMDPECPLEASTQPCTCGYTAVMLSHAIFTVKDRLRESLLELHVSHSIREREREREKDFLTVDLT